MTKATDATGPSLEGAHLGRYRLRFRIAQGGMAAVYLAQLEGTHGFERWVAVKVVHPHLTEQRRFANMLLDEARVAARIHHPNVCAMLDFGEEKGVLYLVMEYLHGESFSSAMRRAWKDVGQVEPWFASRVVLDAAMGLQAAHDLADKAGKPLGVVHRDVSPQNIQVLYQGQSKVVDFGIARARGRLTSTEAGEIKGKLSYMAPEQIKSQPVDHRTDVWALGVILWEATTGKRLFRTESHGSTVLNVVQMDVPRPSSIIDGYPPALETAILGALERDRERRTQTAGELGAQLEEFLYSAGRPAGPRQVSQWMKVHFASKLEKRDAMLRDADSDLAGPIPEIDLESESSVASRVRGTDASEGAPKTEPRASPLREQESQRDQEKEPSTPDTQAEIPLPEARPGLAVAPLPEVDDDDDDDGATVIADPPSMGGPLPEIPPPIRSLSGLRSDFDVITSPDGKTAEALDSSMKTIPRAFALSGEDALPTKPLAGRAQGASPAAPPIATPFASNDIGTQSAVSPRVMIAVVVGFFIFILLTIILAVALTGGDAEEVEETTGLDGAEIHWAISYEEGPTPVSSTPTDVHL